MRPPSAYLLMTLGMLGACEADQPGLGWQTSVDTLATASTQLVRHQPSSTVGWALEEVFRVGTIDGDGPTSFSGVRGLVVLEDERFAVLDDLAQEVRVFAPDGTHLATHGRKGSGPGEFDAAFGLMRDSRDRLWVPDYGNARMSVLDPDLGLLWSRPIEVLTRAYVWRGTMLDNDHVWKPSFTLGPPRANVMRVYNPASEVIDSLPMPPDPDINLNDPPGAFAWSSPDGRSNGFRLVPYFPLGETVIDPVGAVWSTTYGDPSYRIVRWEPGGDTILVVEAARPRVDIPESVRDSTIRDVREELSPRGAADQDWSKVPTAYPAVAGLFVSEEGDLWVRTRTQDSEVFDVYSRTGEHRRTVANSLNLFRWLPPVVRGDNLWAVVADEFDVHYVVRARVVPADVN